MTTTTVVCLNANKVFDEEDVILLVVCVKFVRCALFLGLTGVREA